ncbi:hypothetical protein MCOR27_008164 [Pyricularia oryzae]|uniref:NAD(P)-binding protein n=2 Tax=Pyricularia TaxID=48558 RepID=A0ABQ8N9K1_PYRGI|nr:hypothetical protein MCOR01_006365 [Pyricularia oryzae]KAI6293520.1 hypothetical protein MCOR33_009067 [Pyricularia grisea]KAH9435702.1 hypothetical protein MCOR02_004622 [Pyricularia oryzae]KAI6258297.1 hypothetical protein MCOR19_005320 [Pyricularia oryzae]KAI6270982.1 hypothetical protein MCOR26_008007 [Pyricularia oryzae]
MSAVVMTLKQKLFAQPMVAPDSFKGKKALVTGGTAGLGLATAIHLAQLGASTIAITCRDASRGESAKKKIEEAAGSSNVTVKVLELDMGRYPSVVAFTETVKKEFATEGGLDWICLNAGVHNASWEQSPEGWDMVIQVNVLSTVLISLLLLPWLKELRSQRQSPAHLTIVSSGLHMSTNISRWEKIAGQDGLLKHFSAKENWPGAAGQYGNSKLLLQYCVHELSQQALDAQGKPDLIINTCCPGMVWTEITRTLKEKHFILRAVEPLVMTLVAQTPEVGSRTYLKAGLTTEADHSKFITNYLADDAYVKKSKPVITSETAQKVQRLAWAEVTQELTSKVPSVSQVLTTK